MIKFSCFSYALIGVSLFFMMGCSSLAENRSANTSTYRAQQPLIQEGGQATELVNSEANNIVTEQVIGSNNASGAGSILTPSFVVNNHYTIDFGMFEDVADIESFVRINQLDSNSAGVAEVRVGTRRGYLLAYGVYFSRDKALRTATKLAEKINTSIVVRPIAEIEAMAISHESP